MDSKRAVFMKKWIGGTWKGSQVGVNHVQYSSYYLPGESDLSELCLSSCYDAVSVDK